MNSLYLVIQMHLVFLVQYGRELGQRIGKILLIVLAGPRVILLHKDNVVKLTQIHIILLATYHYLVTIYHQFYAFNSNKNIKILYF